MIITAKATKPGKAEEGASRNPYAFKDAEPLSKAPKVISLLLVGIVLYIKSMITWHANSAAAEEAGQESDKAGPQADAISIDDESGSDEGLDKIPVAATDTGNAEDMEVRGSGDALVDLQDPATFLRIPSPTVEGMGFLDQNEIAIRSRPVEPFAVANDNGSGPTGPGGSGSEPGGPGEDPDDDAGEDPSDEEEEPDEEDEDNPDADSNRAPRVNGPVHLADVTGCAALIFGLSDLLAYAYDPDGDALSIKNLEISSGTLSVVPEGWRFEPSLLGTVTITYEISDGALSVAQHAYFDVLKARPIIGTDGSDTLVGTECADDIDGGACDDNIDARGGNDVINGGTGNDHIVAGAGHDTVFAGDGNDVVFGGTGNDRISGGKGNDRLFGDAGDDTLFGDEGDDTLLGDEGADLLFGGDGQDFVSGDAGDDVAYGGNGDDQLAGGDGRDALFGEAGNDVLSGGPGTDLLSGGAGSDQVSGGSGDDTVVGDLDQSADDYDGGEGSDSLDYSLAMASVSVDLTDGLASGCEIGEDTIADFETVETGAGDDMIIGTDGADTIRANAGDDRIFSGAGDDVVSDGNGSDTVDLGDGDDILMGVEDGANDCYAGGGDADALDYSETWAGIMVDVDQGYATGLEIGTDSIEGFESISGGNGNDHFIASGETVSLRGNGGDDVFEFKAATGESAGAQVTHTILDFMVGDRIKVSKYEIFEKIMDAIEDQFQDVYGTEIDKDELPIRIRHEQTDNAQQTFVDIDFDMDEIYEMSISMEGNHVMLLVDTAQ